MGSEWKDFEERRQRAQQGPRQVFVVGILVGLAFFAWTQYFGEPRKPVEVGNALQATLIQTPTVRAPQASELPAPSSRSGRESYVSVYECVVNGQRVVSDKPCGPQAQARTLVVDQPDPRDVARQQQTLAAQQSRRKSNAAPSGSAGAVVSVPAAGGSNDAACSHIDQKIEQIDARMRLGYTAQQGERYREQLRELKEQRYALGCRR